MKRATLLAALLLIALAIAPASCAGTGGQLVSYSLEVRAAVPADAAIVTAPTTDGDPWRVELLEAWVLLGGVYVMPPVEDVFGAFDVRALLGPAVARAHGGEDSSASASALAVVREPMLLDLLDDAPLRFADREGEAGDVGSVRLWLGAPREGVEAPETRGHHAFVAGVARRGSDSVPFEIGLDIEDTELKRRVDDVPVSGAPRLEDGCTVALEVRAEPWLELLEFDRWLADDPAPDPDGVYRPAQPSELHTGWRLRAQSARSFGAAIDPGAAR